MCTANIRFPVYFSKFVSRISCFEYVFPFTKSLEFMSQEKFYSPSWNNKTTYKIMFCKQWDQWSLCGGKTFRGTWENLQCLKEREIQEEISRLSWKAKTEIPENQRHIEVSDYVPQRRENFQLGECLRIYRLIRLPFKYPTWTEQKLYGSRVKRTTPWLKVKMSDTHRSQASCLFPFPKLERLRNQGRLVEHL